MGVGAGRGWYESKLSLSAAFFFFKPKKQHESQPNLWKQRTRGILTILWVNTKYLHISDQFYLNLVKYRPSFVTKTLITLIPDSALLLTKILPPPLRRAFYPFQGLRLHILHLETDFYQNLLFRLWWRPDLGNGEHSCSLDQNYTGISGNLELA